MAQLEQELSQAREVISETQTTLDERMAELGALKEENARLQATLADAGSGSGGDESSTAVAELKERIEGQSVVIPCRTMGWPADWVQNSRTPL